MVIVVYRKQQEFSKIKGWSWWI